jgi:hypothetical protein
MAKKITAIRRYQPEIQRQSTRQMREIVEDISRHTGLNEGQLRFVIYALRDAMLDAHRQGQAVKIDDFGTFTPVIRIGGDLDILFRPDPDLLRGLNDRTKFRAKILNKANVGKSSADLIAQWNKEHPDDPVEE